MSDPGLAHDAYVYTRAFMLDAHARTIRTYMLPARVSYGHARNMYVHACETACRDRARFDHEYYDDVDSPPCMHA